LDLLLDAQADPAIPPPAFPANRPAGQIQQSGLFLREDGSAGFVQQIDVLA
jgi:hypothetical protein